MIRGIKQSVKQLYIKPKEKVVWLSKTYSNLLKTDPYKTKTFTTGFIGSTTDVIV